MTPSRPRTEPRAGAPTDAPWWRGASVYQIYPRSFADSNDDGVGDLPGITGRLDYVASLGVEAIWVSPFYPSPMHDFGYDVAEYCDVDPIFGTLADFDAMAARARALGLKLLIDQVYSHTSNEHAWFRVSRASRTGPKADWYVWADPKPDGSPPNNWQGVFGGPAWTWDARRGQYYFHNFLPEQPQLNVRNPAVQNALIGVARFWLDRGVDGFRLDAINFAMHDPALTDNPPAPPGGRRSRPFDFQRHVHNQSHPEITAFLERLSAAIAAYSGRFTLAEIGGEQALAEQKAFTRAPGRLDSAYGFDFLYSDALTPDLVRKVVRDWPGGCGEGWPSWALSNHDAPRFASRWAAAPEDRDRTARLGLLLLAALRGNPILYQGEELGLGQANVPFARLRDPEAIANWPETLGRDGARTPMPWTGAAPWGGFSGVEPWLPVDPMHLPLSVAAQDADPGSVLNWTRALVRLRRQHPALRTGTIALTDAPGPLVAFTREGGGERLLCVFNLAAEAVRWWPEDAGAVLLATDADATAGVLPPRSGLIAALA